MAKRESTKGRQRSTKHTHKTKDRVTRTALKTGRELICSGRVSSSCSTSGTRRVNLVTNFIFWVKVRYFTIPIYAHTDNIYISSVRLITSTPVYDEVALYIFVVDLGKVGVFSLGTPFVSTNTNDCHDLAQIQLDGTINTHDPSRSYSDAVIPGIAYNVIKYVKLICLTIGYTCISIIFNTCLKLR